MKTTSLFVIATLSGLVVLSAQSPSAEISPQVPKTAEVQGIKSGAPVPKTAEAPTPKTAETSEIKTGAAQTGVNCRPVVEQLRQNVQKAPNHVLTLLEDAVVANGGHCVGDLVQAAIVASNADPATVKKIVFVAITNAPKQAPEIAEAAVAASPKSADSVRAAFAEAFDEKNPRLKATDPAAKPAWEQAGAPVGAPKKNPVPMPTGRSEAPAPVAPNPPQVAANATERNPYTDIDRVSPNDDGNWKLLHDGVVESGKPGAHNPQGSRESASAPGAIVPPPPLEEEKKKLGFDSLSFLVPRLPELPPVDAPVDLYFSSPFGGIPAP